jgi:hypothetical protein
MRRKAWHDTVVRVAGFTVILVLCLVVVGCVAVAVTITKERAEDDIALHEVSGRLGVAPTWALVQGWLEGRLQTGLPRTEVHSILGSVGPYRVIFVDESIVGTWYPWSEENLWREELVFTEGPSTRHLGKWLFHYDADDHLVRWRQMES